MNIFPFSIFGFVIDGWTLFGFLAQIVFFLRMLVQWISSEARGKSVIPVSYWYLSLIGGVLVFIYAVARRDAVITLGQFIAFSIYARNIFLYRKEKSAVADIVFEHTSSNSKDNGLTKLEKEQAADFSEDYRLKSLFSMVPSTGGALLDIGSGNGEIANFLRGKFNHFTLADISEFLCERLRKKFKDRNDISVMQADGQSFSSNGNSFDVVTMTDIIEHVADDGAVLKNGFHVLNPGGLLFVSAPALPYLYGIRDKESGHYRRYTKKELTQKLIEQGFRIRTVFYWNLLGVLPYFVSEKMLEKPIGGPMRRPKGFISRALNRIIYAWLLGESKIPFLPMGLTLIAIAEKPHDAR